MQIFVDADACPVVGIVEKVAKEHNLPVTLLCDTNHVLSSDYSEVIVVGAGADAVDYKLISICHRGDIVVSHGSAIREFRTADNPNERGFTLTVQAENPHINARPECDTSITQYILTVSAWQTVGLAYAGKLDHLSSLPRT